MYSNMPSWAALMDTIQPNKLMKERVYCSLLVEGSRVQQLQEEIRLMPAVTQLSLAVLL